MTGAETYDVAVVGAGIVGLAHAYHAARRGKRVILIERGGFAVGASVRNFGLVWPIGQPAGAPLQRALRARQHWLDLAAAARLPLVPTGSLHAARHRLEMAVLEEFVECHRGDGYEVSLLTAGQAQARAPVLRRRGLRGALWSATELTVTSPAAIRQLPFYLHDALGVELRFDCAVTAIDSGRVETGRGVIRASHVFVCTGAELQALFPEVLRDVVNCKLQMLSVAPVDPDFRLGPALCAGLTLLHYDAFARLLSLPALAAHADAGWPEQRRWGIHVLVSQHADGELIIGDSHEYGRTLEPFDRAEIDRQILRYLDDFALLPPHAAARHWHGIYPKLEGATEIVADPLPGVTVVNALGGAGMTLSLGLAEEVMERRL